MPLYIPWLTETIKKRGVRYLLHHYLGQFFEEKLTLEQLSIDIYEGKGSIRDLALDVDGLNDELDFIPFKFLDGCIIEQISVEVPWSSLATDACKVELDGAQFVCRLKTSVDGKAHCMESTMLNRSLMTSSMQMAEDIVTHEDDDDADYESPNSSFYGNNQHHHHHNKNNSNKDQHSKQMFEGLEMFAQLIDSVLRRTKLTARNTIFRIEPQRINSNTTEEDEADGESDTGSESAVDEDHYDDHRYQLDEKDKQTNRSELYQSNQSSNEDDIDHRYEDSYIKRTGYKSVASDNSDDNNTAKCKKKLDKEATIHVSDDTVEFLIKFFRCEEVIDNSINDQTSDKTTNLDYINSNKSTGLKSTDSNTTFKSSVSAMPETVTKLLTLEDVEMRIGGVPASNLVGKHTITIKFNGQKSEISIFSGSPLLAVISHEQLKTFFNVFDSCAKDRSPETGDGGSCGNQLGRDDLHQQVMSPEDYAKIENQLLESVSLRKLQNHQKIQSQFSGRRWLGGPTRDNIGGVQSERGTDHHVGDDIEYLPTISNKTSYQEKLKTEHPCRSSHGPEFVEPSLNHIEAFSCQLKLPGIWLCLLLDGEVIPPLIKPYADSVCSFKTINKYIDKHIKAPHLRCLALKVSLDITPSGTNIFLGDLDISEHLKDPNFISPIIPILRNDEINLTPTNDMPSANTSPNIRNNSNSPTPSASSSGFHQNDTTHYERYKAKIVNNKDIVIESLTRTRLTLDPTLIDRLVYDYKLFDKEFEKSSQAPRSNHVKADVVGTNCKNGFNFTVQILGDHFKVELLCPIPDLTPTGCLEPTKIRPQSFLFEINGVKMTYEADKLTLIAQDGSLSIKTQPQQKDLETVRFIEATSDFQNMIALTLEPYPSRLDCEFPRDDPLNGSTMCGSIYVGQVTESRIPTEAFATKRKLVRQSTRSPDTINPTGTTDDHVQTEKILTPGDREHLQNYLNQTVMSTKFSINMHLPICKVQIEDKEQLDLIYNRFANDFVFWQPRILQKKTQLSSTTTTTPATNKQAHGGSGKICSRKISQDSMGQHFQDAINIETLSNEDECNNITGEDIYEDDEADEDENINHHRNATHNRSSKSSSAHQHDEGSEVSYHSFVGNETSSGDIYANEVTCKVIVDELSIIFNHQSCASALKQEITSENLLLGVVLDVNNRPNTILSMVADNLELASDSDKVLAGNNFSMFSGSYEVISTFSLTTEIKRHTPDLKNIRLALQLNKALFNDFKLDTFKRFWQSINVTDEPILGYVAPKIIIELHVNILNTGLMVAREGARPALLAADELYITSMVMDEASAPMAMLRVVGEEMSLYLKRNRKICQTSDLHNNNVKNFVCLIDSGVIDLDVKLCHNGRVEFGVINNVINIRVCQDSLSALCKLVTTLLNSPEFKQTTPQPQTGAGPISMDKEPNSDSKIDGNSTSGEEVRFRSKPTKRELELLEAAMNELGDISSIRAAEKSSGMADYSASNLSLSSSTSSRNNVSDTNSEVGSESVPNQLLPGCESNSSAEGNSDVDDDDSDDYATETDEEESSDESDNDDSEDKHGQKANNSLFDSTTNRNACILDQSNPMLDDIFLPPLMPSSPLHDDQSTSIREPLIRSSDLRSDDDDISGLNRSSSTINNETSDATSVRGDSSKAMDESGFFVIGDDDVGAGILDNKRQKEPVIRQLIEGPITIIDDYFKITKPRTIPELLATSLERYLLEEMTLVINLFGGHDFEDGDEDENDLISAGPEKTLNNNQSGSKSSVIGSTDTHKSASSSADTGFSATPVTTGSSTKFSSVKQSSFDDMVGVGVRAGTTNKTNRTAGIQHRRKHLSEGSSVKASSSTDYVTPSAEQRDGFKSVRFGEGAMNLWESLELSQSSEMLASFRLPNQFLMSPDLKQAGGPSRQTDKSIQLCLSKIKCLYESGQPTGEQPISWRFILLVQEIEIRDRLEASDINKMLYEYTNEQLPRRSVPQLTIKNVATINPTDECEECDLRVSVKPLRLNVDQDTLMFLIDFFTNLTKSLQRRSNPPAGSRFNQTASNQVQSGQTSAPRAKPGSSQFGAQVPVGARAKYQHQHQAPSGADYESDSSHLRSRTVSMSSDCDTIGSQASSEQQQHQQQHNKANLPNRMRQASESSTTTTDTNASGSNSLINQQQHSNGIANPNATSASKHQAIYIKSFTFSPDLPIRVDYHAKHMDLQQGALAGILMGLADLDHSELVIRRLQAKHGIRGLDRVLLFALNHWLQDIKRNQVPNILSGIGPIHHVIDLFKGIRDLILMPIEQYRRDKRLVRGLQKGASSFSSSTAMAAISLMNRFISIIQCTAQIAHDIVTPPQLKQLALQHQHNHSCSHHSTPNRRQRRSNRHSANISITSNSSRQNMSAAAAFDGELNSRSSLLRLGPSGGSGLTSSSAGNASHHLHQHHHHAHSHMNRQQQQQHHPIQALNQPRNFCEGVTVGFNIIREGLNDTARNVAMGMQADDMRSTVGGIVRQIPSTLLNPIISATEGAQNVLVGMRNQIAPDARRQDQEKWKRRVKGRG